VSRKYSSGRKQASIFSIDEVMKEVCHKRILNSSKMKLERADIDEPEFVLTSHLKNSKLSPSISKAKSVRRNDLFHIGSDNLHEESKVDTRLSFDIQKLIKHPIDSDQPHPPHKNSPCSNPFTKDIFSPAPINNTDSFSPPAEPISHKKVI